MKNVVILECEKCGKTAKFNGNVLKPSIRTSDPYWGYREEERLAEYIHKDERSEFIKWDTTPGSPHELCPECKQKRQEFICRALEKANKDFWEEDTEE